jgi:GH24 family phage-related lysozyme (muramidase)
MATFTDIYKQELKGKGILNSIGTAALKRTREKLDIRNMLFGGSGAIAATGQKVFGKGYQAIQKGGSTAKVVSENIGTQSIAMDQLLISSQKQESQLAIIAKNTMNSNAMARDMNVMRQNIMKLVTMGGGKASRGADMFFKDAAARESAYESQFKKGREKQTTPTPVAEKSKSGGMLAMFGGIATAIVGTIRSALGGIPDLLKSIFSVDNLLKMFGIAGNVISGFAKLLPMLVSPAFLGIIAAIAGATWLMKWLGSKNAEANTQEKTDLRTAQDRGSQASKLAARTILINDDLKSLLDEDRTDQDVSDYTRGEIKTKSELAKAITTAEKTGKHAIEIKDSVVASEAQERLHSAAMQSMQDGSYATAEAKRFGVKPESLSPTPAPYNAAKDSQAANTPTKAGEVSENLVNFVKKKEGFSPRAFWDHKQWSIGYGTKSTEGEVITEREADKRLREVLQKSQDSVLAHARKNNYDFNQNQVDALTSFVYNLGPGILNQLTAKGSRSIEEIAAKIPEYNKASGKIEPGLQKRRAEEYAMFSSPGSNTGSNLTQGSNALAAMSRDMNVAQAPNVVVNAPQTTVASNKGQSAPVASATNVDALELFFKYAM